MNEYVKSAGIVAALGLVLLLPACSEDGKITASDKTAATTATTARAETTTTAADAASDKKIAKVNDPGWAADATAYRGDTGATYEQDCPPNPDQSAGSVWGAGTYTDDSSICTAAVQSGLITFDEGGTVTYAIADGLDTYAGATANGVASSAYGSWDGSFTFPDAAPGTIDTSADPASWSRTAQGVAGGPGTRFTVQCAPGGVAGALWGSGPYTADSSVCTAGAHAGVITAAAGGSVRAELAPGEDSYPASTRNQVTSADWGPFDTSFVVIDAAN